MNTPVGEQRVYIYGLWHPDDPLDLQHVRYIGYSSNLLRRMQRHFYETLTKDFPRCRWILKLLAEGHFPRMSHLETVPYGLRLVAEMIWIAKAKTAKQPDDPTLLNVGEGGSGVSSEIGRLGGLKGGFRTMELEVGIFDPDYDRAEGGRRAVELKVGPHAPENLGMGGRATTAREQADPAFAKELRARQTAGKPLPTSGYRNVYKTKHGKFRARFRGKQIATFETPQEAAKAYDDEVEVFYGKGLLDRLAGEGVFVRNRDLRGDECR